MAVQYYRHNRTGQVYSATERSRPPTQFFETRIGDDGRPEFSKVSKPKPKQATEKADPEKGD